MAERGGERRREAERGGERRRGEERGRQAEEDGTKWLTNVMRVNENGKELRMVVPMTKIMNECGDGMK